MKNQYLIAISCLVISFSACVKQDSPANQNNLTPPAGFLWELSKNVDINISTNDNRFGDAAHNISVYDKDPKNGGVLIAKGAASTVQPFAVQIYLADTVHSLVIIKTAPDLSIMQQSFTLDAGRKITAAMGMVPVPSGRPLDGPDCNTGCSRTITATDYNINVASNEVVCITGSNITVSFNANSNGTVRICGTNVTVQNANLNNGSTLIVASTGSAVFQNLNINDGISFQNFGNSTITSGFYPNGPVTNAGILNIGGDVGINASGSITNTGSMTVQGTFTVNSAAKNSNRGTIHTNAFTINGGGAFTNLCTLQITGDVNINGKLANYQLVTAGGSTTVNGGAEIGLYNSAMYTTDNLTLNGTIQGYGTTSLIKIASRSTINGGSAEVKGALQYCDANGIEINYSGAATFKDGAVQDCSVYIPSGDCNNMGNGTEAIHDTDDDGVADSLDEYPADGSKAFNNYYPTASGKAIIAFEDLWPSKGDYDFNDMVVDCRYNIVTNAANKVAGITSTFTLLASGGTLHNGFGISYPLAASAVSGVTGGTLEANQANAVLIIFPDVKQKMQYGNTVAGSAVSAPVTFTTSFNVANGPLLSNFGLNVYNPFIWNNATSTAAGRNEIHLPGHAPTSLGSTALFGTKDDNSNTGAQKYYLTTNGMPWALTIPAGFKYPKEGADVTKAYSHFAGWANSGGAIYPDWYVATSGNVVNSYLYQP